jgi:hypothetical protein
MNQKKLIKLGLLISTQMLVQTAHADMTFPFNPCSFTIGGQAQFSMSYAYGGVAVDNNDGNLSSYGFLDLRTGLDCKINSEFSMEAMLRQRPIVGSGFAAQANYFGSREAWVGTKSNRFGALRWGRFLNKMWSVADYPYGDGVSSQSSDYGSTPTPITRNMSFRYISPEFMSLKGEVTFGGDKNNQDTEAYLSYNREKFGFDGVYSRNVMDTAYEEKNGKPLAKEFKDRHLVNSAAFLGGHYDFTNGASVRLGMKTSVFSMPSNEKGVFNTAGKYKTNTRINSLIATTSYPISSLWKFQSGIVRYFDSQTRGVKADDGATFYKLGLSFMPPAADASIGFDFGFTRLDRAGAIPGSGSGANQAIPNSTDKPRAIDDRRWVFGQDYGATGYNSRNVRSFGITLQKNF